MTREQLEARINHLAGEILQARGVNPHRVAYLERELDGLWAAKRRVMCEEQGGAQAIVRGPGQAGPKGPAPQGPVREHVHAARDQGV